MQSGSVHESLVAIAYIHKSLILTIMLTYPAGLEVYDLVSVFIYIHTVYARRNDFGESAHLRRLV